ncbi:two-component system, OmpR family, sensor kinase [Micromonospora pattaloongensis]|uniref:histidine kinase n=1 Tax=Micromonospora pattaloongensis TaxID=405436 RepID=A0A1H3FXS4_9ACTN|nr:ATP-binding protein [Micromonospora pattaloongensis]SDX95883.1 two-component system, OmpR family, sensor kinase [Micromonospora pattaloongensis]
MNGPALVKERLRSVPLRVKLVASVLVLMAAGLVVISAGSALALRSYLIGQIDADLKASANTLRDELLRLRPGVTEFGLPSNYVVVFISDEGTQLGPYYDDNRVAVTDLPLLPTDPGEFDRHQGEFVTQRARDGALRWRMYYTRLPGGHIGVGQSLRDVDRAVGQLVWIDVLVGGIVLVVVASLGAAIVRTSLKPLVEIEQTAGAIAAGDLSRRVPDPEPGQVYPQTELGRLSRALNAMLAQIEAAFTARAASESASRTAEAAARDAAIAAQSSEARARRSEERMRQFVADASHELRTPLTTIRGFAELYRQGAAGSPEDVARLMRRIEDEAARMGLLVEDLLLLARLDRERPLALAPVELPVLASDAVHAARAVAPDRTIRLEVAPEAGPLVVLADDGRLRQVIGNLMTNAITHTPPEASVTMRLRTGPGDIAVIEVSDTGQGLTPEQAERVFQRFYRADAARTRRGGATSTGLGLAIVAAIVAAHRGTVEVESEPGHGTTFRVKLPLAPGSVDIDQS